eukprot:s3924_g3.t1
MRDSSEVGGLSASEVTYVIVDMPGYVGPTMVEGHPTWVCIPKQQLRHEAMRGVSRMQFPLVLSYGMTVHKSQGLTLADGCVFNMDHEPTWCPLKCIGLAFVGMSRTKDFAQMAFKYVPDYWVFYSVKDTDIFKWRASLELRLDELHDATAAAMLGHELSVAEDLVRHVAWSEQKRGVTLSEAEAEEEYYRQLDLDYEKMKAAERAMIAQEEAEEYARWVGEMIPVTDADLGTIVEMTSLDFMDD